MDTESNTSKTNSIIVTGTKGKTTVCSMLNHLLITAKRDTLLVDTTGTKFNDVRITTFEDSLKNYGKSPNVRPGRYIYWHIKSYEKDLSQFYSVLEASFACNKWGTGITEHDVGIFTNVYRDHIDFVNLKSEDDIYEKKSFVFKNIKKNGVYISFLDNEYTKKSFLEPILKENGITSYGVTLSSDLDNLKLLKEENNLKDIYYYSSGQIHSINDGAIYDLKGFRYFQNGNNISMIINAMFTIAYGLIVTTKEIVTAALDSYLIPEEYGRFLVFKKGEKEVTIDYAHEPNSLKLLVDEVKNMTNRDVYLVTRIASDRNNEFIKDFAQNIKDLSIKGMTIFDKIDGVNSRIYVGRRIKREIGESATILNSEILNVGVTYTHKIILNELEALKDALKNWDNIILIYSTLDPILDYLKAEGFKRVL